MALSELSEQASATPGENDPIFTPQRTRHLLQLSEIKYFIARSVAKGLSDADIAQEPDLPRPLRQTGISRQIKEMNEMFGWGQGNAARIKLAIMMFHTDPSLLPEPTGRVAALTEEAGQVAIRLARGMRQEEVARTTGLTDQDVSRHMAAACRATGARGRVELAGLLWAEIHAKAPLALPAGEAWREDRAWQGRMARERPASQPNSRTEAARGPLTARVQAAPEQKRSDERHVTIAEEMGLSVRSFKSHVTHILKARHKGGHMDIIAPSAGLPKEETPQAGMPFGHPALNFCAMLLAPAHGKAFDMLTKEELKLAIGVAQGKSNEAIAQETGKALKTVKNHLTSVTLKIQPASMKNEGVRFNRTHLAAYMFTKTPEWLPVADGAVAQLPPHSRATLLLVAQGLENEQVADVLGRSVKTVKNYLANASNTLGADNRTQLAGRVWAEYGTLENIQAAFDVATAGTAKFIGGSREPARSTPPRDVPSRAWQERHARGLAKRETAPDRGRQ